MDNKNTTLLGIGLAALTVGLGYLGYVVVSNNSGDNISVEKSGPETEKIKVEAKDVTDSISLEEETVGKLRTDEKMTESLLTRFWKNEFNQGFDVTANDLDN